MAQTNFCFCFGQPSPSQSVLVIVQAASFGIMFDSSLSFIHYIKLISKYISFTFRIYREYNHRSPYLCLVQAPITFCLDGCNSVFLTSLLPLASLPSVLYPAARTSHLGSNGSFSERPARNLYLKQDLLPVTLVSYLLYFCPLDLLGFDIFAYLLLIECTFHEEGTLPVLFSYASLRFAGV